MLSACRGPPPGTQEQGPGTATAAAPSAQAACSAQARHACCGPAPSAGTPSGAAAAASAGACSGRSSRSCRPLGPSEGSPSPSTATQLAGSLNSSWPSRALAAGSVAEQHRQAANIPRVTHISLQKAHRAAAPGWPTGLQGAQQAMQLPAPSPRADPQHAAAVTAAAGQSRSQDDLLRLGLLAAAIADKLQLCPDAVPQQNTVCSQPPSGASRPQALTIWQERERLHQFRHGHSEARGAVSNPTSPRRRANRRPSQS